MHSALALSRGRGLRLFLIVGFVLAFYGFVFDFVNPLTPTPIAVVNGKSAQDGVSLGAVISACLLAQSLLLSLLRTAQRLSEHRTADLLDLTGRRRC